MKNDFVNVLPWTVRSLTQVALVNEVVSVGVLQASLVFAQLISVDQSASAWLNVGTGRWLCVDYANIAGLMNWPSAVCFCVHLRIRQEEHWQ